MAKLVQLPDGQGWVNPEYVTLIALASFQHTEHQTRLWVVANAGYGAKQLTFKGDRVNELAELVNGRQED